MTKKDVTVQIMLGGKSTRMGTDKALVKLGGKTLLERAVECWRDYGGGLQLSVGAENRAVLAPEGISAVADVYTDRGPMGGLHAGLLACATEYLLLIAVDSPFVTCEMADALVDVAEKSGCDACVYTLEGRPQPLFALYRKTCLAPAEELLKAGENKMGLLLRRVNTRYLEGVGEKFFRNLNTPEELFEAEKLFL